MNGEERTISVAISREAAYDFLKELASDDDVRARVVADPGAELASRGIVISPELLLTMGDDPADKLGRPKGEAWPFHLLTVVFMFGALPFAQRAAEQDGAS